MKIAWKEYQKDIADDNYFYARSCIRQNFFPGSEAAFLNILRQDLGRDVYEDPRHTSCTGIGYHSDIVPLETIMTVVARQFSLMTEAGYENFVPSCITSFGIYSEALELWHDFPELEEKAHEYLYKATGRDFKKPKNLAHTSDVIFHHREEIAAKAKRKLVNVATGRPLRGVEHIGCHYTVVDSASGTIWSWPIGAIRSPTRNRSSSRWLLINPILLWRIVRGAPCFSINGSMRFRRWRGRFTVPTGREFPC